jgi:hypothetical protein
LAIVPSALVTCSYNRRYHTIRITNHRYCLVWYMWHYNHICIKHEIKYFCYGTLSLTIVPSAPVTCSHNRRYHTIRIADRRYCLVWYVQHYNQICIKHEIKYFCYGTLSLTIVPSAQVTCSHNRRYHTIRIADRRYCLRRHVWQYIHKCVTTQNTVFLL